MSREAIRELALEQISRWPALEVRDLIKALYQSAFGCGHFIPSEAQALAFLKEEMETAQRSAVTDEPLSGEYSRLHLGPCREMGLRAQTLSRLFLLSAVDTQNAAERAWFSHALDRLEEIAAAGELPFSAEDVKAQLDAYRAAGCPAVHHSQAFRAAYHPAYRVVRRTFAQLLPVFARIDTLLSAKERVIVAIDGNSGAGKSTIGGLLARVYDGATLVHMDDFFLQPHQRTQQRLAAPGGNVDYERFLEEVLVPMRKGGALVYRPYDCAKQEIAAGETIAPGRLCIAEGSYSLHPALEALYDLKIVLRVGEQAQRERILVRNGEWMLNRFVEQWIPLENLYFDRTQINRRCDLLAQVIPLEGGAAHYVITTAEEHT